MTFFRRFDRRPSRQTDYGCGIEKSSFAYRTSHEILSILRRSQRHSGTICKNIRLFQNRFSPAKRNTSKRHFRYHPTSCRGQKTLFQQFGTGTDLQYRYTNCRLVRTDCCQKSRKKTNQRI